MITVSPSCGDFEKIIGQIEGLRQEAEAKAQESQEGQYVPELFYRGQADFRWHLETTLGRSVRYVVSLNDYYGNASEAKLQIETFTDKSWEIPTCEQYSNWLKSKPRPYPLFNLSAYTYFVYLRHHRFPSPLLDWTSSPYIAAFFAMENPPSNATYVSVYVFWKDFRVAEFSDYAEPAIHVLGPNVRTHRRHFLQQSRYTICASKSGDHWVYAKHEDAFENSVIAQDLLWKINIPISARPEFLAKLHKMNINSFSLFATEDSLLETLAADIFLLNPKSKG